jgi:hypothetical protein
VDRLTAVEQSIFMEAGLSELFTTFATSFYSLPEAQAFWEKMARAEANHAILLEFEKWRLVREELDAGVRYDDPALIRQMKRLDDLRASIIHPPDLKQTIAIALKAENMALDFHNDRIFIAEFGVSDRIVTHLVSAEDLHRETLEKLAAAADPRAVIQQRDLDALDQPPPEA